MAKKNSSVDIFFDAQQQAGWKNPIAEAIPCKIPTVCMNIGGVRDFAFQEKTTIWVHSRDPEVMASAILKSIENKKLQITLRENTYLQSKQFDWDKNTKRLEKILIFKLKKPNPYSGSAAY